MSFAVHLPLIAMGFLMLLHALGPIFYLKQTLPSISSPPFLFPTGWKGGPSSNIWMSVSGKQCLGMSSPIASQIQVSLWWKGALGSKSLSSIVVSGGWKSWNKSRCYLRACVANFLTKQKEYWCIYIIILYVWVLTLTNNVLPFEVSSIHVVILSVTFWVQCPGFSAVLMQVKALSRTVRSPEYSLDSTAKPKQASRLKVPKICEAATLPPPKSCKQPVLTGISGYVYIFLYTKTATFWHLQELSSGCASTGGAPRGSIKLIGVEAPRRHHAIDQLAWAKSCHLMIDPLRCYSLLWERTLKIWRRPSAAKFGPHPLSFASTIIQ